jgi:Ca2+-binding RTX toxin-like protein
MATRTWLAGSDDHAATGVNWANGLPQSGDALNITTGGTIDFSGLTGDFSATIAGPLQVSGNVDLSNGPTRIGPAQTRFINSGTIDLANSKIDADLAGGGTFAITPVHDNAGVSTGAGTTELGGTVQAGVIVELEGEDDFAANLIIDKPQSQQFLGLLEVRPSGEGSTGSDEITLKGLTATSYAFVNKTLTLFDGLSKVTTLRLDSTLPLTVTQDTPPGVLPNVTLHFGNSVGTGTILPLSSTSSTATPPLSSVPPMVTPPFSTTTSFSVTADASGIGTDIAIGAAPPTPGSSTITQDSDVIIVGAGVDTITVTGNSDTVFGGAGNATISGATSTNLAFANLGGSHTLFAGAGTPTVFGSFGSTVGSDVIVGGSGALLVATGESNDTIFAGTAAGQTIFGGYSDSGNGSNVIHGGTEDLEIAAGGSNDTIFSGAGNDSIYIGNGNFAGDQLINGGTGGSRVQFVGGAGSATVVGGAGAATVFGIGDSNIKWIGGPTGGLLDAVGNVTSTGSYDASGSTSNDTLIGASGNVSITGGSGNDFLVGGVNTGSLGGAGSVVGGATLAGGAGTNTFIFTNGLVNGGDIITDFSANDFLSLSGYGAGAAGAALANATSTGGTTTLQLSDGTSISFLNTTTSQLTGHIFSS